MVCIVVAYIVMACIVMAYMIMACIGMAYIAMACIVMNSGAGMPLHALVCASLWLRTRALAAC